MNRLAPPILILTLVLALAPGVSADYADGWLAYQSGDYVTALAEWQPLADQGHAWSQYRLGVMHVTGSGVPRSLVKAVEYYRMAADQGLGEAQNALAFMYRVGNGVAQDDREAVRWYVRAAEQGVGQAQYNLAGMLGSGRGVEAPDFIQAYKWYSLAAMHGVDDARKGLFFVMDRLSPEEIAEGQRQALAWRPRR